MRVFFRKLFADAVVRPVTMLQTLAGLAVPESESEPNEEEQSRTAHRRYL